MLEIFKWIAIDLLLCVGLLSTIIPPLPGVALILFGIVLYVFFFGLAKIGLAWFIGFIGLTAISFILANITGLVGARIAHASKFGMLGGIIGSFLGMMVASLPGAILGSFLGAFALELMTNGDFQQALRSGKGAFVGFLVGGLMQFVLGLSMIVAFLILILR